MFRSYGDIERPSASSEAPKETHLFKCNFCGNGWESETDVYIHRTREHEKEIQKLLTSAKAVCLICFTQHPNRKSLHKHINSEHLLSSDEARRVEREIYICDYCCQIFFNKQLLVVHHAHVHKTRRGRALVQCPKCARRLRLDTIWSHFQYHQIQSISCCPICLTKCLNREEFKRHLSSHVRHYHCDSCMYQATKVGTFYEHLDRHRDAPLPRGNFEDEYFDRFFVPRVHDTWRYQKMSVFKGLSLPGNMRLCILCREICTCRKEMRNHILTHNLHQKQEKKKFVCVCGEEFFNRVLLKQHTFKLQGMHQAFD